MKAFFSFLFCVFLLQGCGATAPSPEPSSEPYELDLSFRDLNGQEVQLKEYRGRVVLLTYWATWCFACQTEMRSLDELQEYFGDRLLVLAVAVRDSSERVREFQRKNHIRFPVLLDPEEKAACASGGDGSLPLTLLVSKNGRLLSFPDPETGISSERVQGPRGWNSQKVVRALEEILSR